MKIAIAADHAGFALKEQLRRQLAEDGHEVVDFGTNSVDSCDYPDYAQPVAREVGQGRSDRGILVCSTGIGMSIAANKVFGVRAALAHDEVTARIAREHNHCNVLCLGTDLLSEDHIRQIVEIFLGTPFADGRHVRRINKLKQIEVEERCRFEPRREGEKAN